MAEEKRVRRTNTQIAEDIDAQIEKLRTSIDEVEAKRDAANEEFDAKIANIKRRIDKLNEKKKALFAPKKPRVRKKKSDQIKELVRLAQKSGMKLDEIAEKLGVEMGE